MADKFIIPGRVSGNPYKEAESLGRQPLEGFARDDAFLPRSASPNTAKSEILMSGLRDSGVDTSKMVRVGGTTSITAPKPYLPDYSDPSRMFYPKTFHEKVQHWKLFLEQDPVISNLIELYSDMPISDVKLTGEGVEGDIKEAYETMMEETKILSFFPHIVRSYLGLGEAIIHNYFDSTKGIWSHVICHDPERVQVMSTPLVAVEPFLMLVPDEQTTRLLKSTDPLIQRLKLKIPAEILKWLYTKKGIPLDTSVNCTFIPRRLFPWDVRGTAILSRLWRIFMLEDSLYNATLQTARRHACFVKGTPVLTDEGIKSIEKIKVGDTVISGDGQFKKVLAAWEEEADKVIEIKVSGSELIECTSNHRFKIWVNPRKCYCGCGEELGYTGGYPRFFKSGHHSYREEKTGRILPISHKWKTLSENPSIKIIDGYEPLQTLEAKDIRRGDYFLIPRKFEVSNIEVNEENKLKARLLGYYVAEGCRREVYKKRYGVTWTFSVDEFDTWAEDLVNIGDKLGVRITKYLNKKNNDSKRVGSTQVHLQTVKDIWLAKWCFKNGGMGAKNKVLSKEVMQWPLALKEELLRGMFRGDGHKAKSGEFSQYGTVSRSLAYQVRLILAQLGIFGSVRVDKNDNPNWSDSWSVISSGEGNRKLREIVWGEKLGKPTNKGKGVWTWMDDDYIYVPVLKVSEKIGETKVYNLTVDGDHSYIANGLRSENSPVKVVKMGNAQTGWIPGPEHEDRMIQLLQYAETDPQAWLVVHYGYSFEAWGTTDKAWTIGRDSEMIERIKLIAMGVSKAFISGEVTYASAEKGLQVFLTRLKHLRTSFEQSWWYPRFFRPIAEMNKWVLPTRAETDHRIRIKRSPRELQEDKRYIIPKLEWEQSLDYKVKRDVLDAYSKLENIGIKISKSSTLAAVGLDFEEEARKIAREKQQEQEINREFGLLEELPEEKKILETSEDSFQVNKDLRNVERTPVEVDEEPMPKRFSVESKVIQSAIWDAEGKYKGWHYADVEPFVSWLKVGECIDDFWSRLIYPEEEVKKVATGTSTLMVKAHRGDQGYFQAESDDKALFKLMRSEMGGMSRVQTTDYQIGDWVLLESPNGSGKIGEVKSIVPNYKDEHSIVSKSYVYGDPSWTNIETFLKEEDFLDEEIQAFKEIVVAEGLANTPEKEREAVSGTEEKLQKLMDELPDDAGILGEAEIDGLIQKVLGQEKMIGDKVETKVRSVRKKGNGEDFLTGGSSGVTPFVKLSDMGILPHE